VAGGGSPGTGGATTAAVGVGVRRERVLELVDRFEGAGIEVAAVDLRSAALLRACAATGAGGGGGGPWQADGALRTILDLGWGNAAMVLARHGLPVYERTLPELGLGTLVGQVAQALRVDAAAAEFVVMRVGLDEAAPVAKGLNPVRLAEARELIRAHHAAVGEELRTAREYAAAGPDDPVLVAGATASPGLAAGIAAAAHAKVSVFSPAWCKGRAGATELERPDPGALAVALGLALHPVWAGGRDAGEGRAAA
jgi:Tfp pilus assembly PilM family ATPase